MELKKNSTIMMVIIIVMVIGGLFFNNRVMHNKDHLFTIGILQTASHPALDAARDGFVAVVKSTAGDKIDCVVRNGQGSVSSIHTIAQQFHAKRDIDMIYAIATPAAQAAVSVEKEKPIVIAAVSLSEQLSDIFTASNVCGVSDMIDVRTEVEAMRGILPAEITTIGIVYCTAEANSVAMAQVMVTELEKAGYNPVLVGVISEGDIETALLSAARKVDAFLTPTDNMVANAIQLIVDITTKVHKPLIVSDNMLVQHGALMARGVDYYQSGNQAGDSALQVLLHNKKPQELSVTMAGNKDIFVNKKVLDSFGFVIAQEIAQEVVLV